MDEKDINTEENENKEELPQTFEKAMALLLDTGKKKNVLTFQEIQDTLEEIARLTGGRYFRAEDEDALRNIYNEIAQLETHEIESTKFTTWNEIYQYVLALGLLLLLLELVAKFIWGRSLP